MKSRLFLKYFFSYILLTATLIACISAIIYTNSISNIEREVSIDKLNRLKYMKNVAEKSMLSKANDILLNISVDYSSNKDYRLFNQQDVFKMNSFELLGFYKDFNKVRAGNPFIESINFYLKNSNCVVSSNQGFIEQLDRFYDADFVKSLDETVIKQTGSWTNVRTVSEHLDATKGIPVFSYVLLFPWGAKGEQVTGYIYINLFESTFKKALSEFKVKDSETLIILDRNGDQITGVNDKQMGLEAVKAVLSDPQDGFTTMKIHGERMVVSYVYSEINDWCYITLNPIKDFYKMSESVARNIVIACVVALILGLIISYILSQRIYHPVYKIVMALNKNVKGVKKKDELMMISENISELNSTIDGMKYKLQNNIYMDLLHGRVHSEENDESSSRGNVYERMKDGKLVVMLLLFEDMLVSTKTVENEVLVVKEWLELKFDVVLLPNEKNEFIFILKYEIPTERMLEWVQTDFKKNLDTLSLQFTLALGSSGEGSAQLPICYETARHALKYHFLQWNGGMLLYDHIHMHKQCPDWIDYDNFTAYIKANNRQAVKAVMEKILNEVPNASYRIESIEYVFFQLIGTLNKVILEMNLQGSILSYRNIYHEFFRNKTLFDAVQWIVTLCDNVMDLLSQKNQSGNRQIMEKIKIYINMHLEEDLSLDVLSQMVFLSPAYISTQFKEFYGVGLAEYIGNERMIKAAKLLETTDLLMKDVMEVVGYKNLPYFTTKFKQKYGTTPYNYHMQAKNRLAQK